MIHFLLFFSSFSFDTPNIFTFLKINLIREWLFTQCQGHMSSLTNFFGFWTWRRREGGEHRMAAELQTSGKLRRWWAIFSFSLRSCVNLHVLKQMPSCESSAHSRKCLRGRCAQLSPSQQELSWAHQVSSVCTWCMLCPFGMFTRFTRGN